MILATKARGNIKGSRRTIYVVLIILISLRGKEKGETYYYCRAYVPLLCQGTHT